MAERSLYHTYVRNENGLVGESYVEGNQGLALGVSSSLIDAPGTPLGPTRSSSLLLPCLPVLMRPSASCSIAKALLKIPSSVLV